jgi:serine/threonine protein kinase
VQVLTNRLPDGDCDLILIPSSLVDHKQELAAGVAMRRLKFSTAWIGQSISALEAALAEMHRRGVVHLDLRNRTNVLSDEAGRPVLIDFGSALVFTPGGWSARWLLPLFASFDRRALAKWHAKQHRRKRRAREGW